MDRCWADQTSQFPRRLDGRLKVLQKALLLWRASGGLKKINNPAYVSPPVDTSIPEMIANPVVQNLRLLQKKLSIHLNILQRRDLSEGGTTIPKDPLKLKQAKLHINASIAKSLKNIVHLMRLSVSNLFPPHPGFLMPRVLLTIP